MLTQEQGGVCVARESGAFLPEVVSWLGTERAFFSPTHQVSSPLQGNYRRRSCHYSVSLLFQQSIVRCCCPVVSLNSGSSGRRSRTCLSVLCLVYFASWGGGGGGPREEPAHSLDAKCKPDQVGADPSWKPDTVTVLLPWPPAKMGTRAPAVSSVRYMEQHLFWLTS